MLSANLWAEKYRPTDLASTALNDEQRKVIGEYVSTGEIPHLLFPGPAGSGKTTVARIIINALDCQVIELNASSERGIDTIRDKVGTFATSMLGARWNIVFLDEADALTSDAQTALRNLMETYSETTRFILTCNYAHKIIDALQSRCQVIEFGRPPAKERYRILETVLKAESVKFEKLVAFGYAEHYPDMRKMLSAVQKAWLRSGKSQLPQAQAQSIVTGDQLFKEVVAANWVAMKRLTTTADFDVQTTLRELFWAIPDDHAQAYPLRRLVAKAVHESGFTPDIFILFLGAMSEAIDVARSKS